MRKANGRDGLTVKEAYEAGKNEGLGAVENGEYPDSADRDEVESEAFEVEEHARQYAGHPTYDLRTDEAWEAYERGVAVGIRAGVRAKFAYIRKEARDLRPGDVVVQTLRFDGFYGRVHTNTLRRTVRSVQDSEDGQHVIVTFARGRTDKFAARDRVRVARPKPKAAAKPNRRPARARKPAARRRTRR